MKTTALLLAFLLLISLFSFVRLSQDDPQTRTVVPTGIQLDSIGNEVMLIYENDLPVEYMCEVFTPVCNTGECLPVYVNFHWRLNGTYIKFDQPEGEILTKADHEPFSEDDYEMLHDILIGPDPRMASPGIISEGVKHNDKEDKNVSHSSPAPSVSRTFKNKYEMVDAISGSTLPEIKDRFVPGALYTTYTLWGLAHDQQYEMVKYTRSQLLKEEYYEHFMTTRCGGKDLLLKHIQGMHPEKNGRANALMNMLDTGSVMLGIAVLDNVYWNEYQTDTVCATLEKKFFESENFDLQVKITRRWAYNYCRESTLVKLSEELVNLQHLFGQLMDIYLNKSTWPSKVFSNMIAAYPLLHEVNQKMLLDVLEDKKDIFSNEERKELKGLNR